MHKDEHEDQRGELHGDRTHRQIEVILENRIQPVHADGGEPDREALDEQQHPVGVQIGKREHHDQERKVCDARRDEVDREDLPREPGEARLVAFDLRAFADGVVGDAERGEQGEIRDDRKRIVDFADVRGAQYTRDIGEGDEREDEAHHRLHGVEQRVAGERRHLGGRCGSHVRFLVVWSVSRRSARLRHR